MHQGIVFQAIQKSHYLHQKKGAGIKILTPKQMIQRLLIALAQVKADNNSENLFSNVRQIVSIKRNH